MALYAAAEWIESRPPLKYFVPAELAPTPKAVPGHIGCLVIDREILETRSYVAGNNNSPQDFYRTRAKTTLRIYEARSGRMMSEHGATGPDPLPFESRFSDVVRYRGDVDLSSIHQALRGAMR